MTDRIAVTRKVSSGMMRCELTQLKRTVIDIDLAREQHAAYEQVLRNLGYRVESLPEEPDLPDSVFVEDTAVVLDEVAVITRPGAPSRRAETASIAAVLGKYRQLLHIESPGTLDGGDVLRIGRTLYVGLTKRTNAQGVDQLETLLRPYKYRVLGSTVRRCLHLKSAVGLLPRNGLLINPSYVDRGEWLGMHFIDVDRKERLGANALMVGEDVIYPGSKPRTAELMRARGIRIHTVDMSEMEKAEGGVTCCSLLIEPPDARR
jgi:dimethylargininase